MNIHTVQANTPSFICMKFYICNLNFIHYALCTGYIAVSNNIQQSKLCSTTVYTLYQQLHSVSASSKFLCIAAIYQCAYTIYAMYTPILRTTIPKCEISLYYIYSVLNEMLSPSTINYKHQLLKYHALYLFTSKYQYHVIIYLTEFLKVNSVNFYLEIFLRMSLFSFILIFK